MTPSPLALPVVSNKPRRLLVKMNVGAVALAASFLSFACTRGPWRSSYSNQPLSRGSVGSVPCVWYKTPSDSGRTYIAFVSMDSTRCYFQAVWMDYFPSERKFTMHYKWKKCGEEVPVDSIIVTYDGEKQTVEFEGNVETVKYDDIFLIKYRGDGKTTLGRLRDLNDLDGLPPDTHQDLLALIQDPSGWTKIGQY